MTQAQEHANAQLLNAILLAATYSAAHSKELGIEESYIATCETIAQCMIDAVKRPGSWEAEIGHTILRNVDPDAGW